MKTILNQIIAFVHELFVRWSMKSPKFAAKVQWIAGVLIVIIPSIVAAAQSAGWGWDQIMINLYIMIVTLPQFLAGVVVFLAGVFGASATGVENRAELKSRVKKAAPSAKRIL